jgi:predicted RNA-binding Zn-ribbon protein involved in translation (DUF1610 family)
MIRSWRERRAYRDRMAAVIPAVEDEIAAIEHRIEREVQVARERLTELPGTDPVCPRCSGQLIMRSVKEGRNWWRLWVCRRCGHRATLTELPRGSIADAEG